MRLNLATLALAALAAQGISAAASGKSFAIDASDRVGPFRKLWQTCVGSSHASMSMRGDWRKSLARASQELGLKSVRFHGIFDDDMSSYLPGPQAGKAGSNMFNTFSTFDFLQDVGMAPLMELSFMPRELMSTPQDQVPPTVMHYRGIHVPPKNWTQWDAFVEEFMANVAQRYSSPSFVVETWNEPNCGFYVGPGCGNSTGNKTAYFELYSHTSKAIRRAGSNFRLAGPVTAQLGWIDDFLTWAVDQGNAPVDLVTSHLYPTDPVVDKNDRFGWIKAVGAAADVAGRRGLNFTLSEFNAGLMSDPDFRDGPYTSAFLAHLAYASQGLPANVEGLSFWTFSDVFEEPGLISAPFHGGFGMSTVHDVNKPAWCALSLLGLHGDDAVSVTSGSLAGAAPGATSGSVDVVASRDARGTLVVSLANFMPSTMAAANATTVTLTLSGLEDSGGAPSRPALVQRVDDDSCNPVAVWRKQGSPTYPTLAQLAALQEAGQPSGATVQCIGKGTSCTVSVDLPALGMALLTVR